MHQCVNEVAVRDCYFNMRHSYFCAFQLDLAIGHSKKPKKKKGGFSLFGGSTKGKDVPLPPVMPPAGIHLGDVKQKGL